MSLELKYVIVVHPTWEGLEVPIVFPAALPHDSVAKPERTVSAGFLRLEGGRVVAHGYSQSLGRSCRPEVDSALIDRTCRQLVHHLVHLGPARAAAPGDRAAPGAAGRRGGAP